VINNYLTDIFPARKYSILIFILIYLLLSRSSLIFDLSSGHPNPLPLLFCEFSVPPKFVPFVQILRYDRNPCKDNCQFLAA